MSRRNPQFTKAAAFASVLALVPLGLVSNSNVGDKGTADPAGICVPHNNLNGPSNSCVDDREQKNHGGKEATETVGIPEDKDKLWLGTPDQSDQSATQKPTGAEQGERPNEGNGEKSQP